MSIEGPPAGRVAMKRLWLIANHASGSADAAKSAAIEAIFAERGLELVGRTLFPDDALPDAAALEAAQADTVVLFAGDGTINAAACKLDAWGGSALILPGGTMNMLAKQLHGDAEAGAIVHAAHEAGSVIKLPFVEAGLHRAFVAMIAGPATTWARAREIVRGGRLSRLRRALGLAWSRSWGHGVSVFDGSRLRSRCNAVIVMPAGDGRLKISAVAAERWGEIARLGWDYVTGDWRDSPAVDDSRAGRALIRGDKAIHALFDGEEAKLASPVTVNAGLSELSFVTTVQAA